MKKGNPQTIYLKDYTPPLYLIDTVDLRFELGEDQTVVHSRLAMRRNGGADDANPPLVLSGERLELCAVTLDGMPLAADRYTVDEECLAIEDLPEAFVLEIETRIKPQENTSLEGLYKSSGNFCTQCEAHGFRKITYFLDRPDVMAVYTTTLVADKARYPVLLSNGNLADGGEYEDGRHWATWQDPHKKPAYLFALVAGDLKWQEDTYLTRSGREVRLRIYVQAHNIDKCDHAMASLKRAMRWDEETYGLEYDLDIYMIVAVDDFNMGAMENKGLNVFNSKYVLARPDTATDADYVAIEGVIGHEYFHNWTGNRVTCRDWFQLSLKEGLTVFRDQEFTADMNSRPVKRIDDVRMLRTHQFAEDASPMAHPVRPDSYIEINNFYTVTVYEKGSEVVRMYHTLLGEEGFRKGLDLYFQRHDGQAVTTDDFCAAMADANGVDLTQFKRWYEQAGTPVLKVTDAWDEASGTYTLTAEQSCAPTPGQAQKQTLLIPIALGLVGRDGRDLPLQLEGEAAAQGESRVLQFTETSGSFRFVGLPERPVPSLLREFSAPVKLEYDYSDEALIFLMAHDNDPFNRWEASQQLAIRTLAGLMEDYSHQHALGIAPEVVDAYRRLLEEREEDPALIAEAAALPTQAYLAELFEPVDPGAIHAVRQFMRRTLAACLEDVFVRLYEQSHDAGEYRFDARAVARRQLKNTALGYLMELDDARIHERCFAQFEQGHNMTDVLAALRALSHVDCEQREQALQRFEAQWRHDTLVMDKWFSLQAMSQRPGTLDEVRRLMSHPLFEIKNPNKVRALVGAFAQGNPVNFHDPRGAGYAFLADQILTLDPLNPQVAARLAKALSRWRHYEPKRQALMKRQLERIVGAGGLSKDVYEIASKSLSD